MSRRAPLVFGVLAALLEVAYHAAADEIRDPTRPPMHEAPASEVGEPAPVLSAVMTFNGKRKAIFNGQVVTGGSVVGAYTIDAVLEDGVRYRRANVVRELHLAHPATTFKKPAAEPPRTPSGVQQ
jgi:cytochrome c1